MKHHRVGQETIASLQRKMPSTCIINGKQYISFKDIFYNLVLNQAQGLSFDKVQEKVTKVTTKVMSPKHRRRIAKQLKKAGTIK